MTSSSDAPLSSCSLMALARAASAGIAGTDDAGTAVLRLPANSAPIESPSWALKIAPSPPDSFAAAPDSAALVLELSVVMSVMGFRMSPPFQWDYRPVAGWT
jgi:hypothetical protein